MLNPHAVFRKETAHTAIGRASSAIMFAMNVSAFSRLCRILACLTLALYARGGCFAAEVLMRFPQLHGEQIIFVARDHLWIVPAGGGSATLLSSFNGEIFMPRYSPDGQWIAFTGVRAGNANVYIIPASGGDARQLTFESDSFDAPDWRGPNDLVETWTPDSKSILFLSRNAGWHRSVERILSVPRAGGLPTAIPLGDVGLLTYSPDSSTLALTRTFSDFRPWKRYEGGLAPKIFTYDLRNKRLTQVTNYAGTDTSPMWFGNVIYFLSDRDRNRRSNLWAYDTKSKAVKELTHFEDFDIDFPSLGTDAGGRGVIAFQQGGRLMTLDVVGGQIRQVPIVVPEDESSAEVRTVRVDKFIRGIDVTGAPNVALSPDGSSMLFPARGDLFMVNTRTDETANLTNTSTSDEDHPAWSPSGDMIAYVTNRTSEHELALRAVASVAGTEADTILTHFSSGYLYTPTWSADSQFLAVADANHALWLVRADGTETTRIAVDPYKEIRDAAFSSDGQWIAFSTQRPNLHSAIHLYDVANRRDFVVSSPMENDSLPRFSSNGKWLYFVSTRNEFPVLSDRETDIAAVKSAGLLGVRLGDANMKSSIDPDGILQRATRLEVPANAIATVEPRGDIIFYVSDPPALISGALPGETRALHRFDPVKREDGIVVSNIDVAVVSLDGKRVAYKQGPTWHIADALLEHPNDRTLMLAEMWSDSSTRQEWREMFEDAWRFQRDMYYNPQMNGVDWQSVHDRYAKLVPLIASRQDFSYLIGQLQGEVGSSHEYFNIAKPDTLPGSATPLLGADFALDETSGRYIFSHVLRGDRTRSAYRAPLNDAGVAVSDGEYLLAVNGRELVAPTSPYELLAGLTGPIKLTIAPTLTSDRRELLVTPVTSELALREYDRTERSRVVVSARTNGRVGYIFLSDFSELGTAQFLRQFYAQQDKKALIIDTRWNSGGFTSQLILERLRRHLAGVYLNREGATVSLPDGVLSGPKVVLINHESSSDADQFAYFFRRDGLGKVVGTRSWGGVRGILGPWPLLDGSTVNVPKDVLELPNGARVIENLGVSPDVTIESPPSEEAEQADIQLETAIKLLLQDLDSGSDDGMRLRHTPIRPRRFPESQYK